LRSKQCESPGIYMEYFDKNQSVNHSINWKFQFGTQFVRIRKTRKKILSFNNQSFNQSDHIPLQHAIGGKKIVVCK